MPDDPKTTRITVSLPTPIVAKLDRVANDARRTRSNAIARLIELAKEPT